MAWRTIFMAGEADFHVVRTVGKRLLAVNARTGQLLVTPDGGDTWAGAPTPASVVGIVTSPDEKTWVSTASDGLYGSSDAGASWARLTTEVGLLAWPDTRTLYLVKGDGTVHVSGDGGWQVLPARRVATPTAVLATDARTVYVAAHEGTVSVSCDGPTSCPA